MADSLLDLGSVPLWFPSGIVNWKQDPDWNFDVSRRILEFPGTGQRIVLHSEETPQNWSFHVTNRYKQEEYELLTAFLRTFQARKRRFWFPVLLSAFELVEDISAGAVAILIAENRMEYRGHERIFLSLDNGDKITRKISSIERFPDAGTIQLTVSAMPAIPVADVEFFSLLALCRFDQDSIKISHPNSLVSETTIQIAEVMEYSQV